MLLRNRELRRTLVGALAIIAVAVFLAGEFVQAAAVTGEPTYATLSAIIIVIGCGLALVALFAWVTRRRYRALAHMAERVDEALHGDRAVSLADMREGELAILASEVDKALNRLTLTADELTAEKRSLADSLADISHQLRTPLTSLGLTLALIRKEARALITPTAGSEAETLESCQEPATTTELLEHIRTSEQLLAQVQWLVEALLKLARIDAGTVELRRERVDVVSLVNAAARPLAIPFELADVQIERAIQPDAHFMGDKAWTCEALENVLKNCLEHTPVGGRVRVEASEDAVACRISVTDTGPGISDTDLPHVFERFYRGAGADAGSVNPAGVGIGLSLARSLVTAQDGRITAGNVYDENGRVSGARFDITFFKAVV